MNSFKNIIGSIIEQGNKKNTNFKTITDKTNHQESFKAKQN